MEKILDTTIARLNRMLPSGARQWLAKNRQKLAWCALYAVALVTALVVLGGWVWQSGLWLPTGPDKTLTDTLTGQTLTFTRENRQLTVSQNGQAVWQTDPTWVTEDFLLGDIDADGENELLVLVWKRGSYGPARPFWVKENDKGFSQHIFLYKWQEDTVTPFWMSSALQPQVEDWSMTDEGLRILTPRDEETLWAWRSWGLERLDGERAAF